MELLLVASLFQVVCRSGFLTNHVGSDLHAADARVEGIVGAGHVLKLPHGVQRELLVASFGPEDVPDGIVVEMDKGLDILEAS